MKKLWFAAFIAAATLASAQAQPPVRAGEKPPAPGKPGEMRPPVPPAAQQALQQVTTYTGSVVKLRANNDYVYDGFYMIAGSDSLLVKFPPHLGSRITTVVKTGTGVSVNGVMHTTPEGIKEIGMVSLAVNGNTITDTARALATTPPAETYVSGNGKITSLQKDREGRVNGFIVDNKTILHVGPGAAGQLATSAASNTSITYTGMQKGARQGEVSAGNYAIVHCKTVTLNGQQYLVQ